eukprot:g19808.t1
MDRLCQVKEATEVENEVLLFQFVVGVIVTLEEAPDGRVIHGMGGGVEVVCDRKVLLFVANSVQVLYKVVSEPLLGLTDVEEATSGAGDAIDDVDGCAGEPLSDVEGLFGAFNGVANHFNSPSHSLDDMSIRDLLQCDNDPTHKLEEQHLIFHLGSLQPNGLNVDFT